MAAWTARPALRARRRHAASARTPSTRSITTTTCAVPTVLCGCVPCVCARLLTLSGRVHAHARCVRACGARCCTCQDTLQVFVPLDFPRTKREAVVAAFFAVFERWEPPAMCLTMAQLLEVAAELRVRLPRERLLAGLRAAQLRRIHKLSEGSPAVAAQLYALAAAADPHESTYHLRLGDELAALGNLTGASAAFAAAIHAAGRPAASAEGAEGAHRELVRARLNLALALETLEMRRRAAAKGGRDGDGGARDGGGGGGALPGDPRVAEQYQELVRLQPDADALWYLLARALRRSAATGNVTSARAMETALRLFASSSRAARPRGVPRFHAHTGMRPPADTGRGAGWERAEYLRGAASMPEALSRYRKWQMRELEAARARGGARMCMYVYVCVCMTYVCMCVCMHECVHA